MSENRIIAMFLVGMMLFGGALLFKETDANPAPSRDLTGLTESYNISFNKPTFYDDYDPNYPANELENNTWDDISIVVFLQDMHTTSVKENAGTQTGTADCADIYQALFVPLDGVTLDTGTTQRILMEDFTATWCIYCTAVVGAMERMDHDSSWFPDKYVGIEWHSGGGTYGTGTALSVATARRGEYNIGTGIPRYVIDGMDPWVGGNSDPNHTATESNIKSRINGRIATAKLSIEATGGHDDTKAWVDFTVTVEDSTFDNIMVEANAVLVQDAFPRRHGANNGAYLGYIANDHKQFRIFDIDGTPPSISGITPAEDSVLSGDVEIKFTASDPDADDAKITSKVEVKKAADTTWSTIGRTEGKYIWKTAEKAGLSYIYPDGDYQVRISATDYWDETASRIVNVSIRNPDPPTLFINNDEMYDQIGSDGKLEGVLDILWSASDDEDAYESLAVTLLYKSKTAPWTIIATDVPNTGSYEWDTMDPRVPDESGYELMVRVADSDGMETELKSSLDPFRINNPDAPTISLISLLETTEVSGKVYLKWNAIDDEDIYQSMTVDIYLSDDEGDTYDLLEAGTNNDGTYEIDTTKMDDGAAYRLKIIVRDSDGMTAEVETAVFSIYNNDEPVVSFISPRTDDEVTGTVKIKWNAFDDEDAPEQLKVDLYYMSSESGYDVEIVRSYPNSGEYEWDTSEAEDGDGGYTLKIRAHDTRGGTSAMVSVFFDIYNPDAPTFTTTIPPTKDLVGSGSFSWIAEDPDPAESELLTFNVYYSSDKITWTPLETGLPNTGSYTWDVSEVPDGTYALKIEIPDPVDDTLSSYHIFDNVVVNNPDAPTVTFTQAPANGANVSGVITFNWEGEDLDGDDLIYTLQYRLFGASDWTTIVANLDTPTYSWNTSSLTTGNYQIRIVAKDDSKSHLEAEHIVGPFEIYVKKTTGPDGNGDDEPPVVTEPAGDDNTVLIVAVVVLFLLLFVVIGLVAVVMMKKKNTPTAPLPPPGGMPLPPGGQKQLPPPQDIASGKL